MIKKLFKKKEYSKADFVKELLKPIFNLEKIEEVYNNSIDLNEVNEKGESLLHLCSKNGYIESSKWLLNNNANIEITTIEGETPLFYATLSNSTDMVKFLLEKGANIEHLNSHKRTTLQEAVIAGKRTVNILLQNTKNLNNSDIYGNNLIFDVISNGNIDLINTIINNKNIDINKINNNGYTILHKDTVINNNDLAIKLLEKGANPTILDSEGKNFLFYAISKGIENELVIDKAIELGCDLNSKDSIGQTVLMHSVNNYIRASKNNLSTKESHLKMIKKLLNEDIEIAAVNNMQESVFFDVIRSLDISLINLFLEYDEIDLNHKNINNETILTDLCLNGIKTEIIIRSLLKLGLDPNIPDVNGSTIIEKLIDVILYFYNRKKIDDSILNRINDSGEYIDVLKLLLKNSKVDLNKLNSKDKPLFFDPILYFNFELFKILKHYDIDINQKDKNHHNIIFYIMEYAKSTASYNKKAYLDTLQNLINLGVDINAKDLNGSSASHKAVLGECEYTIKVLLDAKPDYLSTDNKGRNLIHNVVWKDNLRFFNIVHSYNQSIINIADRYGVLPVNYAAFMGKYNLVIKMLDEGAHINNTNIVDPRMIDFFKKFHINIIELDKNADNELDKLNVKLLVDSMKETFNIEK